MHPDVLRVHVRACREALGLLPFGVNVPLMYPEMEAVMQILAAEHVPVVFTSAGNSATWTDFLHQSGCKVVHVVSSAKFARKAEAAGVDAVVAEGFEAGGHNGREQTTTMCLVPAVRAAVSIPVLAAGGIATGAQMLAARALGADGVQIGTRFALCLESSASEAFKARCRGLAEGDTRLLLTKLSPTRLICNEFARKVAEQEDAGASAEELRELLGRGRAKRGIFEGDLIDGELEIGQCASLVAAEESAEQIIASLVAEYQTARLKL